MTDGLLLDRLADKILIGDGCWEWIAGRTPKGYGWFRWDGRPRQAHRVVYELMVGPIPAGLTIDHLCRNRGCVRPDHLEPVANATNVRRGGNAIKIRCKRGHELTDANVYRTSAGSRGCRACRTDYQREWARSKRGGTHA